MKSSGFPPNKLKICFKGSAKTLSGIPSGVHLEIDPTAVPVEIPPVAPPGITPEASVEIPSEVP